MMQHALESRAGLGIPTRIDAGHAAGTDIDVVVFDGAGTQINADLTGERGLVDEVALDLLAEVAHRDDDVLHARRRIEVDDVLKHRPIADLDHRFWQQGTRPREARALSPSKNNGVRADHTS